MSYKSCKKSIICISLILIFLTSLLPNFSYANSVELPSMHSPSAILMDYTTGKILYEKNIYEKRYPASLTKVMTAIVVLEKCKLNEVATVSYNAVMSLSGGYVTANLQIDEELTIEQLLYLLLVASSNDAAIVLAEHISGGIEEFSVLMNEKAKELGCQNTNFVNPNGVHDENHYSTAYDLALIGKAAMQDDTFRKLAATTSYKLPTTNQYDKDDRYFTTTNNLLILNNNDRADNYYYKYATGMKTGFTTPAGNCLIASSSKDNLEFITVVLGSDQTDSGLSERYLDTISLFNYGYDAYIIKEVAKKGQVVQTINVNKATNDTKRLDIYVQDNVSVLIKKPNMNDTILPNIKLKDDLKAPVKKDDIVGTITYNVEGVTYTYDLMASSEVKPSKIFRNIIIIMIIILISLGYIRIRNINKKKNTRLKKPIKRKSNYRQY